MEKLARLCDSNERWVITAKKLAWGYSTPFSTDLTIDYITKAVSIKDNYLEVKNEIDELSKNSEIIEDSAQKSSIPVIDTEKNMNTPNQIIRKRGSILKSSTIKPSSIDLSNDCENSSIKKKKVHWPQHLPRYTVEKRWRNIRKVIYP